MTRTLPAALLAAAAFACPAFADAPATQPTTRPAPVEVTLDTDDAPTTAQAVPASTITDKVEQTSVLGGGREFTPATPENVTAVTQKVYPAVVSIEVKQEVYRNGKRELRGGIGSGVIIDQQGHILTNYHVAGRAAEMYVTLANKERIPAKLVGDDHWTDLAVVQLDPDAVARKGISYVHADLGTSKSLVPGQPVAAIGTPFGLARTLTLGVVSNTERTFYPDKQSIDEYETGEFANWIQMDTPIAPGNSGGPLVDMDAKVVGINTRGAEGYALAFAIPIDTAKPVIRDILATASDNKPGRVERADLGIDLKPLQDLESFYDIDINRGVLVNSVDRGGPSADAGLRPQDILLSVAGRETNVRFPEEVAPTRNWIADLPIGTPVEVVVKRGGQDQTFSVTPEKLEGAVGQERELKAWGLSVRDVTRVYANDNQLDDDAGVVITTIRPEYPADKAELRGGDVIVRVDGRPVADLDAFMDVYAAAQDAKTDRLLLDVRRGRGTRTAVLKVNP